MNLVAEATSAERFSDQTQFSARSRSSQSIVNAADHPNVDEVWRLGVAASPDLQSAAFALLLRARIAFYHIYVAFLLGLNTVVLLPVNGNTGSSTPYLISWLVMQAIALVIMATKLATNPRNSLITISLSSFIAVSVLWSVSPDVSATYAPMLACNLMVAYCVSCDLTLPQAIAMVSRVILVLAIVGIALYFVGYQQVLYFDAHNRPNILGGHPLRGFFPHKILAGLYMTIGAVLVVAFRRGVFRVLALAVLVLGILLTGSASALIMFFLACFVYWMAYSAMVRRIRPRSFVIGVLSVVLTAGLTAWIFWEDILSALGRDDTLTGRTVLWDWGLRAVFERPISGWGFNAYLNSSYSEQIYIAVPAFRNWDIPHFHQSFIQTAVDFGIIGVAVLVGVFVSVVRNSVWLALTAKSLAGVATFAASVTLFAAGFVMFLFFNYNHFATVLLMIFYFSLWSRRHQDFVTGSQRLLGRHPLRSRV